MSIKIENVDIFGWEGAIRGARNPMNSWEKSDTIWVDSDGDYRDINGNSGPYYGGNSDETHFDDSEVGMKIGPNDHKLLMNLCKGGTEESKWRRMVHVQMDITAPLYWWKEFDTYKVGTTSNSCSTMHKIQAKEFTLEDFSCEHLGYLDLDGSRSDEEQELDDAIVEKIKGEYDPYPTDYLCDVIQCLNACRELYLETKNKHYWWQMIQLLPSSYNQRRTIDLNYEVLASQYEQRKDHKLDEWREYCEWIKTLPYSEFITGEENKRDD